MTNRQWRATEESQSSIDLPGRYRTWYRVGAGWRMPPAKKTATKPSAKQSAAKKSVKATKSAATRAKMAQSQQSRRAVSNYLEALHVPKRRGRKVPVESLKQRLRDAESQATKT